MRYTTTGTCAKEINFDIVDNQIKKVQFIGGCSGNHQAISNLVEGMQIDRVISMLEGIECGARGTSCPDQLAAALKQYSKK